MCLHALAGVVRAGAGAEDERPVAGFREEQFARGLCERAGADAQATAEETAAANGSGGQASTAAAKGKPRPAPLTPESLEALNQVVGMYGMDRMRPGAKKTKIPKDVNQLVKEGFLTTMPVAPKGFKLIINQQTGLVEMG